MPNLMPNRRNARTALLEASPFPEDRGHLIGRDPRRLPPEAFSEAAIPLQLAKDAIRAKCLDCCAGSAKEVRKCVSTDCPLWALRVEGSLPAQLKRAALGEARPSPSIREAVYA